MSLPPSEVQYQLAHIHEDRASAIIISHAVLLPLAVIAVVARFIARRLCKAHIGLDDYMIVVALVRLSCRRTLLVPEYIGLRIPADRAMCTKLSAIGEATGAVLCMPYVIRRYAPVY